MYDYDALMAREIAQLADDGKDVVIMAHSPRFRRTSC